MKKEIKYRAWDIAEKRMWFNVQKAYDTMGHHCCEDPDCDCDYGQVLFATSFGEVLADDNYITLEYTNLKDADGAEINPVRCI